MQKKEYIFPKTGLQCNCLLKFQKWHNKISLVLQILLLVIASFIQYLSMY